MNMPIVVVLTMCQCAEIIYNQVRIVANVAPSLVPWVETARAVWRNYQLIITSACHPDPVTFCHMGHNHTPGTFATSQLRSGGLWTVFCDQILSVLLNICSFISILGSYTNQQDVIWKPLSIHLTCPLKDSDTKMSPHKKTTSLVARWWLTWRMELLTSKVTAWYWPPLG